MRGVCLFVIPVVVLMLLGGCASTGKNGTAETVGEKEMKEPICTLSPGELQERRAELVPGLRDRAEQVTKLDNGYRLRFASRAGLLDDLTRVIEQERTCCSFLHFKIEVEPDGGPIAFEVTGPPGTREMLEKL